MYPKVVKRIEEKLLSDPLGIEVKSVLRATSQTRTSLRAWNTCSFLSFAFCVPDWFSLTRRRAATFSASVRRLAFIGEFGMKVKTKKPSTTVMIPMTRKKMRQLANLPCVNEAP